MLVDATENQIKALKIVRDNPKIRGLQFAKLMWPNSNMMSQSDKRINSHGLYYMFKLVKRHWLTEHNWKFEITKEGLNQIKN